MADPHQHMLRCGRGFHAVGSTSRSAGAAGTDRAARRLGRARMDAAGRLVRDGHRVRPHRRTPRPDPRPDRHSRRGPPRGHPRRAGRRPPCRASSSIAWNADTAVSRARSSCPTPINVEAITAELKDGLLTVTLPKAVATKRHASASREYETHRHLPGSCSSVAGFVAGLVVTGRLRSASDSRADTPAATARGRGTPTAAPPPPAPDHRRSAAPTSRASPARP